MRGLANAERAKNGLSYVWSYVCGVLLRQRLHIFGCGVSVAAGLNWKGKYVGLRWVSSPCSVATSFKLSWRKVLRAVIWLEGTCCLHLSMRQERLSSKAILHPAFYIFAHVSLIFGAVKTLTSE